MRWFHLCHTTNNLYIEIKLNNSSIEWLLTNYLTVTLANTKQLQIKTACIMHVIKH